MIENQTVHLDLNRVIISFQDKIDTSILEVLLQAKGKSILKNEKGVLLAIDALNIEQYNFLCDNLEKIVITLRDILDLNFTISIDFCRDLGCESCELAFNTKLKDKQCGSCTRFYTNTNRQVEESSKNYRR